MQKVRLADYLVLCKPRVVALMMITAVVGMFLATPGMVPWHILIFGNLGIALGAASAAVINHLVDRRIDSVMQRTRHRPLPEGKITAKNAFLFAIALECASMLILMLTVNTLTAVLTLFSLIGYAVIYTMYLKRATPQNIVIGGIAGAAPPLLGWTAVTGHLDPQGLLLVLIIFIWTPPHFWALAIQRYKEYAKADIPMLPVTHGIEYTKLSILLYTVLLIPISILPFVINMSGVIYLTGALILGFIFLFKALQLWRAKDAHILAGNLFRYSIWYLFALFAILLFDHFWLRT